MHQQLMINEISQEVLAFIVSEVKKKLYYDEVFRAEIADRVKNRRSFSDELW